MGLQLSDQTVLKVIPQGLSRASKIVDVGERQFVGAYQRWNYVERISKVIGEEVVGRTQIDYQNVFRGYLLGKVSSVLA